MKLKTFAPTKSRAQAMVEFAIVLPLLLLLLYGLLEAGRLLFMYSTVVTATRQASRYGSATGQGGDYTAIGGPDNSNVPRYQDCFGIRQAAQRVDFLNSFDNDDILIQYDSGPGTPIVDTCDGDADTDVEPSINNDSRIVVTVDGSFFPIVPRIVPFIERSVVNGNPIRAISARTIVIAISIEVTPPPGSGVPTAGTSQLALTMRAEPSTYAFPGEIITLYYDLTNNGAVEISGISLVPTHGGYTCPATTLAPGASMTCSGGYQITQADVDARSVTAQGVASGTDGTNTITSNTGTVTLTWVEQPRLQLAKSLSTEYATAGGTVNYTFTVTNTGNVPLTSIAVSDPQLGGVVAACAGDLPVTTSITCVVPYVVTENDVNRNPLVNTATATGLYNGQTITSDPATATLWTGPLFLSVSASPATITSAGQVITYTYQMINNTGVILYPPYSLSGQRGAEDCSANTGPIPVGGYILCSGSYTVTQGDMDSQTAPNALSRPLVNNVQATVCSETNNGNCPGSRRVTSNTREVSVTLARTPALTMVIAAATPNPATTLNTVITYTYTVTNTGNVTLTPSITDNRVGTVGCPGALAPGASFNCTGTYSVTQADIDAGSITNQATASAIFAGQTVSSASQSITVLTFVGPRIKLQVTPNPTTYTSAGDFIVYAYTMTNTGSVPIYGPFTITDSKVTSFDCNTATSPLGIGGSTYCVGSYAVTQTDVDKGSVSNSASVSASDGLQLVTSNSAMAVVYVPGAPTLTPTIGSGPTQAPTGAPTSVAACEAFTFVDSPAIAVPGTGGNRTMSMRFRNPNANAVTVENVVVSWNASGGAGGATLILEAASLNGTNFWTGSNDSGGPFTITPSSTLTIPGNNATSTILFTFGSNYQTKGNPSITINLSTPGCTPIRNP
jgi:hypothetical protein